METPLVIAKVDQDSSLTLADAAACMEMELGERSMGACDFLFQLGVLCQRAGFFTKGGVSLVSVAREAANTTLPWPEHVVGPCEASVNLVSTKP